MIKTKNIHVNIREGDRRKKQRITKKEREGDKMIKKLKTKNNMRKTERENDRKITE